MLEEFIQANSLKARILHKNVSGSGMVRCKIFLSGKKGAMPVLAVFPSMQRIDLEKLVDASGISGLREADSRETEGITGYPKEFLPPISIYGVKLILEKEAFKAQTIFVLVGVKKTLAISPLELKELADDFAVAGIVKGKN